MQNQKEKVGVIRTWSEKRGFAIVRVGPNSSLEKYFLHVSQIRSGTASPVPGMVVRFNISTKPVLPGQLPQAIDADIDINTVLPVSSEPSTQASEEGVK